MISEFFNVRSSATPEDHCISQLFAGPNPCDENPCEDGERCRPTEDGFTCVPSDGGYTSSVCLSPQSHRRLDWCISKPWCFRGHVQHSILTYWSVEFSCLCHHFCMTKGLILENPKNTRSGCHLPVSQNFEYSFKCPSVTHLSSTFLSVFISCRSQSMRWKPVPRWRTMPTHWRWVHLCSFRWWVHLGWSSSWSLRLDWWTSEDVFSRAVQQSIPTVRVMVVVIVVGVVIIIIPWLMTHTHSGASTTTSTLDSVSYPHAPFNQLYLRILNVHLHSWIALHLISAFHSIQLKFIVSQAPIHVMKIHAKMENDADPLRTDSAAFLRRVQWRVSLLSNVLFSFILFC